VSYTIQQQGEWSGNGALDLDYEADSLKEAWEIVRTEIPAGTIYLIYDGDYNLVAEGTTP
jgi:hypothetical protein